MSKHRYLCDDVVFDMDRMTISTQHQVRSLNYNECLFFQKLLDNPNRVVNKNTLKSVSWPDTIVTDSSLQKAGQKIRLALTISDHIELETVSGVGYRLHCRSVEHKLKNEEVKVSHTVKRSGYLWLNAILALASVGLVVLSLWELSKQTNHHLISYLHPDYDIQLLGNKQLITIKGAVIPTEISDLFQGSDCDCLYFFSAKASRYEVSVYNKSTHHSESYLVERERLPKVIEELNNEQR
ncbi:winged helix-turn-helix domain-containing protein [Vibrio ostreicida]|uniref:winged helix-turn-helix domain-containing protein n=1 Tax=Vibrio ostreicida TaxID=526588 RepID=UPI0011810A04|nr:winged helix-turn-helix domain-containing protein [Vibrio ostreicida]